MNPTDTTIDSTLVVDPPIVQDAAYQFNETDRAYIDKQILAVERLILSCLIRGVHATYCRLAGTSAAVVPGDTVCLASAAGVTEPTVTKSTVTDLGNAKSASGVVLAAAAPGGFVAVAFGGFVAPSLTSLATGAAGVVRVNTTTGRPERVASFAGADYPLGSVDNTGWLQIDTIPTGSLGAGGGSVPTGTGFRHVTAGVEDGAAALVANADVGAAAAIAGTKIAPDFGAQDVATTGNLKLGSPTAAVGIIRLPSAGLISQRSSANSSDVPLIGGTADNVVVGSAAGNGFAAIRAASNIYNQVGGNDKFTINSGTIDIADSTALRLGTTNIAASGDQRVRQGFIMAGRNNAASADRKLLQWGASGDDYLYIGDLTNGTNQQHTVVSDWILYANSGATQLARITTTSASHSVPLIGLASPYGVHGVVISAMTDADYAVPSGEYSYSMIEVPASLTLGANRKFKLPTPATEAASYDIEISNLSTGGFSLVVGRADGAGVTYTLLTGKRANFKVRPAGAYLDTTTIT